MKTYQVSFGGGEVSSEMFGRLDDAKRQSGAARMRNMMATPQGSATRRPGTQFVREVKDSTKRTRLIPFTYSNDQTLAIEMGEGYFRFHTDGGTVVGGDQFVTSKLVSTVNLSGLLQFSTTHVFQTGDAVNVSTAPAVALPSPLAFYATYYVIRTGTNDLMLATSRANAMLGVAIPFTTTGTPSIFVHRIYEVGDFITYVSNIYQCSLVSRNGTPPNPVAQTVTQAGATFTTGSPHGFFVGSSIVFPVVPGSSLDGITQGVVYFAWPMSPTTFQVSAVLGGALLTPAGTHTGTPTVNYATHWVEKPAGTPFEVGNSFAEADLFDISYAQSNDVLLFTHNNISVAQLTRLGTTTWRFQSLDFAPPIAAPTSLVVSSTDYGTGIAIDGSTAPDELNSLQESGLAVGQMLYNYSTALGLPAGFWVNIDNASLFVFRVRGVNGASPSVSTVANDGIASMVLYLCSAGDEVGGTYVVTAVNAEGQESSTSAELSHSIVLGSPGAYVTFTWTASSGASSYRIYKKKGNEYGFIGEATTASFTDDGLYTVDTSIKPPERDTRLGGAAYRPSTVAFYEQRVVFGGLRDYPQDMWATPTGTLTDTTYHIPVQDGDRIYARLSSLQRSTIRHVVPMDQLIILTDTTEYRVTPINDDALTPTSISVRPQSYIGASPVRPIVSGASMVFCANRGGHVYDMGYNSVVNGFDPDDVSLRAAHLFDGLTIADSTFAKAPWPVMWFCSSDGKLLGLTYVRNQNIAAWHAHETDGLFESCCAIPEDEQDSVYVVVKRGNVRYIGRMVFTQPATIADGFFVDSGLTYSGSPATTITGLTHLNGETVTALADGVVRTGLVVSGGQITLPVAASKVHVGLPMAARLQNLPAALQVQGYGQASTVNVNHGWIRVVDSARFTIGPTDTAQVPAKELSATALESKPVRVALKGRWNDEGQVTILQPDPLPLTVVSMALSVEDADD